MRFSLQHLFPPNPGGASVPDAVWASWKPVSLIVPVWSSTKTSRRCSGAESVSDAAIRDEHDGLSGPLFTDEVDDVEGEQGCGGLGPDAVEDDIYPIASCRMEVGEPVPSR